MLINLTSFNSLITEVRAIDVDVRLAAKCLGIRTGKGFIADHCYRRYYVMSVVTS